MAKSSIHIEAGHAGYLAHNDRSQKTVNSIFPENENEIFNDKKIAFEIYRSELAARSDTYTKRTNQKLQKKAITHLSAIVNLNQNHSMQDLKKVGIYLENELGTKVFQMALHRDEGHISEEGKKIVNYHTHIEFMGLDQDGYSVRKKLTKSMLIQMQSDIAELLEMERGHNYAREKKPRPKRLGTYEYKAHKKEVSKTVLAKIKDVTAENKQLKIIMQDQGMSREAHAEREALVKSLKDQVRAKTLTIGDLEVQLMGQFILNTPTPTDDKEEELQALYLENAELEKLAYDEPTHFFDENDMEQYITRSYKDIAQELQEVQEHLRTELDELRHQLGIKVATIADLRDLNQSMQVKSKKQSRATANPLTLGR